MFDDVDDGVFDFLESLAKSFIVAYVLLVIFSLVTWPFVFLVRSAVFILSLGSVRLSHKKALRNDFTFFISFALFATCLFYVHIVYGAQLYGNKS